MGDDRFVTRGELNSSLLRIEANIAETNTIIREQNAQFVALLMQEATKRESWCGSHDEEHKGLAETVSKRSTTIAWKTVSLLAALVTGSLLTLLAYLLAHH